MVRVRDRKRCPLRAGTEDEPTESGEHDPAAPGNVDLETVDIDDEPPMTLVDELPHDAFEIRTGPRVEGAAEPKDDGCRTDVDRHVQSTIDQPWLALGGAFAGPLPRGVRRERLPWRRDGRFHVRRSGARQAWRPWPC